jgi:MarR family transcriptional regulator, 2-MHQ and catechol-resistance regulon repressor
VGTHYQGSARERRALDAYIKLLRAAETVSAAATTVPATHRLAHTHFGVLEALLHLGPLCQKELAEKHLKSPANMTATVDQLEGRGLVRRTRSGPDRRRVTIELTPSGRKLVSELFPAHVRRIVELFETLEAGELEQLAGLCRKLGRAVAAADRAPAERREA